MTDKSELDGLRRGAILMLTLDEDSAAEVLKFMSPQDVHKVSLEMARLANISHDELKSVLEEFMDDAEQQAAVSVEAGDHLRAVLTKALGPERAETILDDIIEEKQSAFGIDKLNLLDATMVAEMIRDEHPQIIATILVHLDRDQAGNILELFDNGLRNDVVLRIATFNGVQPEALKELTEVLNSMLDGQNLKRSKMGGVRAAAEILNTMQTSQEESAISAVRDYNEELAQKIMDEMFVFENLLGLDNTAIQAILGEVEQSSLVIALKGATDELRNKFIGNLSNRAAEMFRDDMEMSGPVRISQVESEQKKVLEVVRRLAAAGTIIITAGDDAFV
jgi:flagellar motor switch protein FliG